MDEVIYRFGDVAVYGFGLLAVMSFLWGSFVFYKKGIESHLEENHLFDGVVLSAFWSFICGRVFFVLMNLSVFWDHLLRVLLLSDYPGVDRWGVLTGVYVGVWLMSRRTKNRVVDLYDLTSLGVLSAMSVFMTGISLLTHDWRYGVIGLGFLVVFIFGWLIEVRYRTFSWYKGNRTSARSGLLLGYTLSVLGVLFLVEMLLFDRLVWTQWAWSLVLFVGGLFMVYIRSGRTVTEDVKSILKYARR